MAWKSVFPFLHDLFEDKPHQSNRQTTAHAEKEEEIKEVWMYSHQSQKRAGYHGGPAVVQTDAKVDTGDLQWHSIRQFIGNCLMSARNKVFILMRWLASRYNGALIELKPWDWWHSKHLLLFSSIWSWGPKVSPKGLQWQLCQKLIQIMQYYYCKEEERKQPTYNFYPSGLSQRVAGHHSQSQTVLNSPTFKNLFLFSHSPRHTEDVFLSTHTNETTA